MIKYEDEIRHIFMAYINENYWYVKRKRRLMLTYPEVMLQNKRWSYISSSSSSRSPKPLPTSPA